MKILLLKNEGFRGCRLKRRCWSTRNSSRRPSSCCRRSSSWQETRLRRTTPASGVWRSMRGSCWKKEMGFMTGGSISQMKRQAYTCRWGWSVKICRLAAPISATMRTCSPWTRWCCGSIGIGCWRYLQKFQKWAGKAVVFGPFWVYFGSILGENYYFEWPSLAVWRGMPTLTDMNANHHHCNRSGRGKAGGLARCNGCSSGSCWPCGCVESYWVPSSSGEFEWCDLNRRILISY